MSGSPWDASPPPPGAHPPPPIPVSTEPLRALGVTLIVYNSLAILHRAADLVLWGAMKIMVQEQAKHDPGMRQLQPLLDSPLVTALDWVGLPLAVFALVGSIYLLRGRVFGLAMAAVIVTMVNPGGACCCLFGTGLGIWGLVVLLRPEVQEIFNRP